MKHKVKFLQFYIGNVCNMTCTNCISFNNYAFKGQFDWDSNKNSAMQWSNLLAPDEVAIIGGEPFTNPDLDRWVFGLIECFKVPDFRITTNGSFIQRDIERILQYTELGVNIEISSHSINHYNFHNFFIETYFPIKEILDDCIKYTRSDLPGFIEVRNCTAFFNNSIKEIKDSVIHMHNNVPAAAHNSCLISNCHYVVEGNLYQCAVTATAPLFSKQFAIDQRSNDVISKIKSISPTDTKHIIDEFLHSITSPCDQCSLCPVDVKLKDIVLPAKKEKL
jgi:organic radical activating enzyme